MIISASRITDIPALYSEWFYNRIREGYVLIRNPYNYQQIGKIILSPDKIDGFVFWTKNATQMIKRIHEIEEYKYYFQYTITAYENDVEKNIPDKNDIIIPSFKRIGCDKTIWRYDPIFINDKYTWDYHVSKFTEIAKRLEGYTKKAVISFVDTYKGVNLKPLNIKQITDAQKNELAQQLLSIAAKYNITLTSCAEDIGIPQSSCIDSKMFNIQKIKDRNQRKLCNCDVSIDIGAYNTCGNGCTYCYANKYGYIQKLQNIHSEIMGMPLTGNEKIKQRN